MVIIGIPANFYHSVLITCLILDFLYDFFLSLTNADNKMNDPKTYYHLVD